MRSLSAAVPAVSALVLLLAGGAARAEGPAVGSPSPDATFVAFDGNRFNLSAYRGRKSVVLLFTRGSTGTFACHYCGLQTRDYKTNYEKFKKAGAEVLVVLPGPSDVAGYLRQVGANGDPPEPSFSVPFPIVTDPDFSASRAFGVPYKAGRGPMFVSQPAAFVVGKDGTVLFAHHGRDPSDRPQLSTILGVLAGADAARPDPARPSPPAPSSRPTLSWVGYDDGLAAARKDRKPLLLEFYAAWCGNCHQMDALVYSDENVRKESEAFVCIRVEFDERADLVEKYAVGNGLPVLVLLDPGAREISRLTGFNSVGKVLAACRAAKEGRAPTAPDALAGPAKRALATPEAIAAARTKALAFVRAAWPQAKATAPGLGPDDLVLFTLAASGADGGDADLRRLRERVLATPLSATYQASLRALALSRLDPLGNRPALKECARFLLRTQLENGQWSYGHEEQAPAPKAGDNSNSAYALLGLAACRKAGVEVPRSAVERADAWWRRSQNSDGGWGYRVEREKQSYASMTESGLSSLLLSAHWLGRPATDPAIERARAWVIDSYSVTQNAKSAYQQGRVLYHLYALERVGTLSHAERLGAHDWYADGAAELLANQAQDGSWDDGAETFLSNTCFGLLFLGRATAALR